MKNNLKRMGFTVMKIQKINKNLLCTAIQNKPAGLFYWLNYYQDLNIIVIFLKSIRINYTLVVRVNSY